MPFLPVPFVRTGPRIRTGLTAVAALAAALAICGPAHAANAPDDLTDPFIGIEPLDHAALGESRGGMMIGGLAIDFSVVLRTTVDGAITQGLQTLLTVNDKGGLGSSVTTPIGALNGATMTPNGNGGLTLVLPSGTQFIHQVLADQFTSMIANNKDGVALNQTIDVNVDLPGFHAATQSWYGNNRAAQMGVDAAVNGLGHR